MERQELGWRRAVLQVNRGAVYSCGEGGGVLRGLDVWLGFTGSDHRLLDCSQHAAGGLASTCLGVLVRADFDCGERGL